MRQQEVGQKAHWYLKHKNKRTRTNKLDTIESLFRSQETIAANAHLRKRSTPCSRSPTSSPNGKVTRTGVHRANWKRDTVNHTNIKRIKLMFDCFFLFEFGRGFLRLRAHRKANRSNVSFTVVCFQFIMHDMILQSKEKKTKSLKKPCPTAFWKLESTTKKRTTTQSI